ncbi:MAG: hypothetical protein K0S08_847 [Gammaproteobacteria bacterium]|jgi:hypothetical protein|nr:hypothetical protein [Gammaproteobacteria bacterium]
MSEIDLIDKDFDEIEPVVDESVEDIEEKGGKRRTTKQQLKVRRAIEDHLNKKRFRKEIDYLIDDDL